MAKARDSAAFRPARSAMWAIRAAVFAVALVVSGLVLHRLFAMPTPVALNLFALAFALAATAIGIAFFSAVVIWRTGARGGGAALGAVLLSLSVLAWPAFYLPSALSEPALNDVTTDLETPPAFVAGAQMRSPGANSPDYAGDTARALQRSLYPDIQPLVVDRPAAETQELVVQAIRRLGFEIVAEQEPENNKPGTVEAVARTLVIGFRDDVVVRVIGRGGRSRIDIRSASRWGEHDFGRNADRVRGIVRAILDRLQSTVPAQS